MTKRAELEIKLSTDFYIAFAKLFFISVIYYIKLDGKGHLLNY